MPTPQQRLRLLSNPIPAPTDNMLWFDFQQGSDSQVLYNRGSAANWQRGSMAGSDSNDPSWLSGGGQSLATNMFNRSVGSMPAGTGQESIAFIAPPLPGAATYTIYNQAAQSATLGYLFLSRTSTGLVFQYAAGTVQLAVLPSASAPPGSFVEVIVDYAGKTIQWYVSGELVLSTILNGTPVPAVAGVGYIGSYLGTTHYLTGQLHWFTRASRARTAGECRQHYHYARRVLAARGVSI